MKNMYQCEKCGKVFEDFDECYKHEESHWLVSSLYWRQYEKACSGMTQYSQKYEAPSEVGVEIERYDPETCQQVHAVARYVLKEILYSDRLVSDEELQAQADREEEARAEEEAKAGF